MKIAMFIGVRECPCHQALKPIITGLQDKGHEVTEFFTPGYQFFQLFPLEGRFDLAHFASVQAAKPFDDEEIPKTANLWSWFDNIPHKAVGAEVMKWKFQRIFVMDPATVHNLGLFNVTNVTYVPMVFEYHRFQPLPPPDGEFTVGVFGNNYRPGEVYGKRFHVIEQGCDLAGVTYRPTILSPYRDAYRVDPIRDVYSKIHCYAHASFVDTSSLPVMEALLCGRPAITVPSAGLVNVISEGANGYFFDGSPKDFAEKALLVRDNYQRLRFGAGATQLPGILSAVNKYEETFQKVVHAFQESASV